MLERAINALDDYLNAGDKEQRRLASITAKQLYKEFHGVEHCNRVEVVESLRTIQPLPRDDNGKMFFDPSTLSVIVDKEISRKNKNKNRLKSNYLGVYHCHYCPAILTYSTVTVDHMIPKSKGGDNSYKNLLPYCQSCNNKKADKDYNDFIKEITI